MPIGRSLAVPTPLVRARPSGSSDDARATRRRLLDREGIHGKAVTPALLAHFHEHSGGESLRANVELVLANAGLAGAVAVELAARRGAA